MFLFLSKLLPLFIYPVGLACIVLAFTLWRQKRRQQPSRWLPVALAILWLSGIRPMALGVMRSLEWQYLPLEPMPKAEVIVVLGGATRDAYQPRPIIEVNEAGDRLLYGAWLYRQGYGEHLLLTGGEPFVSAQGTTEAMEMAWIMELLQLPSTALWLEEEARNTYENGVYSREILAAAEINRIILVTSAVHMPRAVAVFEKQGFEVIPAPTDFAVTEAVWQTTFEPSLSMMWLNLLPTVDNTMLTTRALKEYIGLFIYELRGWV